MVLVVGAEAGVVSEVLARAAVDDDVLVLDGSAARLERLFDSLPDPRLWFMIGGPDVIPLPDGSVDEVVGAEATPEVDRVTR